MESIQCANQYLNNIRRSLIFFLISLCCFFFLSSNALAVSPPYPLYPENYEIIDNDRATLEWTSGGGNEWIYQLLNSSGGLVETDIVTSTQVTVRNLSNQNYSWRVAAIDGSEVSDWSSAEYGWRYFTIQVVENEPPDASRQYPSSSTVYVYRGDSQSFTVAVSDVNNNLDYVDWYIESSSMDRDNVSGGSDTSSWSDTFNSDVRVYAYVYDEEGESDYVYWNVDVIDPPNNCPTLSNQQYSPDSDGTTEDQYTFYVYYSDQDGDDPSLSIININGTTYNMTCFTADPSDGVYRTNPLTLNSGITNYYFEFNDGEGCAVRYPTSGTYTGPEIFPADNIPDLSELTVSPSTGTPDIEFTYSVRYYDEDGDVPVEKYVYIDGNRRSLTFKDGSGTTSNGIYEYKTDGLSSEEEHNYYFEFSYEKYSKTVRVWSPQDPVSGPSVGKTNLTLNYVDSSPREGAPGDTINVSGRVENDSDYTAPAAEHQIFVRPEGNFREFGAGSISVNTFSTPAIPPGGYVLFDEDIVIPMELAAGWDIIAVVEVDWENNIDESNEDLIDNNHFTPIIGYAGQALGRRNRSPNSGDPVNTALGNFTYSATDLKIPGVGLDFAFTRNYNSQGGASTPMGGYWSHSYHIYLEDGWETGSIVVNYGDGKRIIFSPDGSGGFTPPEGIHSTLIKKSDDTYTLTHKNQVKYSFYSDKKLSSITDKNNNALDFRFTGDNLTRIADTAGRFIYLTYASFGGKDRIVSIQDPLRPAITYGYDSYGNLMSMTDAEGNITRYTYTTTHRDEHLMSQEITARNKIKVKNYYGNAQGDENTDTNFYGYFVVRQQDAYNNETLYRYDVPNRVTSVVGPDNKTTKHYYDQLYRFLKEEDPMGDILEKNYNAEGNLDWVKDKMGRTTYFTYDTNGNVLTKTDTAGIVTKMEYDIYNNLTKKIEDFGGLDHEWVYNYNPGGSLEYLRDPEGNEIFYEYYPNGLVDFKIDKNGNTTDYSYDTQGNLIKTAGPIPGSEINYTYDAVGRNLTVSDPLSNTTQLSYDYNDNLKSSTDPEGNITSYVYDENNNKVSITNDRGYTTYYTYDDKDRLVTVKNAINQEFYTEYDAFDRKSKATDQWGNITEYQYDDMGNLVLITHADLTLTIFEYDKNGNKVKTIDQGNKEWEYGYDTDNRLVWEEDPLGNRTAYEYTRLGKIKRSIDANTNATQFEYDKMGRIKKVVDSEGGETVCVYDNAGNRLTERDARLNTINYEYDPLNRLEKIIDRNNNETNFAYDNVNMVSMTDGNGATTNFTLYDKNGNLKQKVLPGPNTVSYDYDENGNVVSMTDSVGTTTYSYDELDRMIGTVDPFGKITEYIYDVFSNKKTLVYPDGKTVIYDYDKMGRLWKVTDWLGYTTTYSYDAIGNLSNVVNTKGTRVDYTYDIASRLKTAVDKTSTDTIISSFSYTLDPTGNRTGAIMDIPIVPVFNSKNVTATYDPANQIESWGSANFVSDNAGRQIEKADTSNIYDYTYSPDDRLISVEDGNYSWDYRYNGNGNRLSSTKNGLEKRYTLDLSGDMSQVLCETDNAGNITSYYVYGAGLLYKITPAGERYQYHFDPLGSTLAVTDESEVMTDKYSYDPFGKIISQEGSSENPFKYVGQYGVMQEDNGLLFMRARFYDPETKKFLSRDPVKGDVIDPMTLNPFQYAYNNPMINLDPDGEIVITAAVVGGILLKAAFVYVANEYIVKPHVLPKVIEGAQSLPGSHASRHDIDPGDYDVELSETVFDVGFTVASVGISAHNAASHADKAASHAAKPHAARAVTAQHNINHARVTHANVGSHSSAGRIGGYTTAKNNALRAGQNAYQNAWSQTYNQKMFETYAESAIGEGLGILKKSSNYSSPSKQIQWENIKSLAVKQKVSPKTLMGRR